MRNKHLIFIILFAGMIFVAGCGKEASQGSTNLQEHNPNDAMEKTDVVMEPEVLAGTVSKYYVFDNDAYQEALSEDKTILLYFCASCWISK